MIPQASTAPLALVFGFGCGRQRERHAAAPPPAAVRRRTGRKRRRPVGGGKGRGGEITTTNPGACAPDPRAAPPPPAAWYGTPLPHRQRGMERPSPTGSVVWNAPPPPAAWCGTPGSVWPGGGWVSPPSCAPSWSPVENQPRPGRTQGPRGCRRRRRRRRRSPMTSPRRWAW